MGLGVGGRQRFRHRLSDLMYTSSELTNRYYEPLGSFYLGFFLLLKFAYNLYLTGAFNPIISCHNNLERVFRYHSIGLYPVISNA